VGGLLGSLLILEQLVEYQAIVIFQPYLGLPTGVLRLKRYQLMPNKYQKQFDDC
jgi:hypothetical protein